MTTQQRNAELMQRLRAAIPGLYGQKWNVASGLLAHYRGSGALSQPQRAMARRLILAANVDELEP